MSAASGIPGTYHLPKMLSRFRAEHPDVEIDFQLETSGGALRAVRAHEVEVAVVGGLTVPLELEAEPLVEDEVVLVGPPALGGRRLVGTRGVLLSGRRTRWGPGRRSSVSSIGSFREANARQQQAFSYDRPAIRREAAHRGGEPTF